MPRIAAVAALLVAAAGAAFAAPDTGPFPRGPAFGQNRYVTSIASEDTQPDVDDYVSGLIAGEVLAVHVVASRGSMLQPRLALIGPDGGEIVPPGRPQRQGRAAQISGFRVPASGRWTVRVSGGNGTSGEYSIAFNVKPAGALAFPRERLGDDQPLFKVHPFGGLEGGRLDLKITWSGRANPVSLRSVADPSGREVPGPRSAHAVDDAVTDEKHRTITLSGVTLGDGDGDYTFRVRTAQGTARYDASVTVTPPERPKGKKPVVLDVHEPFLAARTTPIVGRADFVVTLDGRNFSAEAPPRVFFGRAEGSSVSVAAGGTSLVVTVPAGVAGTTVPVSVVNPDGQAAQRPAYFAYLQPIAITDIVDANGTTARAGSTRGGRRLRLLGENFDPSLAVLLGGNVAPVPTFVSPNEISFTLPGSLPGNVAVTVRDPFGGIAVAPFQFRYKSPPTFASSPYAPPVTPVGVAVDVTITGRDFEETDQLSFGGAPVASTFVGSTQRTFHVPSLPSGSYTVSLTDSIGSVEFGPDFVVKPAPTVGAVTIVGGAHVGTTGIPVSGGALVRVDGAHFHVSDVTTLGGVAVTYVQHTDTSFTFTTPAGAPGLVSLSVIDGAGQGTSIADVLRIVGYTDATAARSPGATAADALLATRGAVGDLDGDQKEDDLVLATSYYSVGTRTEGTRIFIGGASGKLADRTAADFPAAGSDSSGADTWLATAVAIGDVDRNGSADIVIATNPVYAYYGGVYNGIRVFRNNGTGHFIQDEIVAPPSAYAPAVFAYTPANAGYLVYGTVFDGGMPTGLLLGDLDTDGDNDLVVTRDSYELRYVGIDPRFVNFATTPPTVPAASVAYLSYFQYAPGTKVYENDIQHGRGFIDRTVTHMPKVGSSLVAPVPSFRAWDGALGDIDKDGDLDLVETWDDPTTVSAYGTYVGPGIDAPRVATRVLNNDGTGKFTDATSSWLPAPTALEFWQGRRVALADLDKDAAKDLDLVILHQFGVDAFKTNPPTHTRSALRILRNDGKGPGFVDVTASALPAPTAAGDDWRGEALAVRDVDGDGWLDIVVGTTEILSDATSGTVLRATRLFRGGPGLKFTLDSDFLPPASADSGDASDILFLGDLSGGPDPSLLFLSPFRPTASPNGEFFRVLDWNR